MIISHKHKFIFLKPYKTAGSSFEYALSETLGRSDVATYLSPDEKKKRLKKFGFSELNNRKSLIDLIRSFNYQNKRDLKSLRWPKVFHPHATAKEVKAFVGSAIWRDYNKISIIRNPWDCLISFYYWNPSNEKRKPFKDWVFDNRHLIGLNNRQYYIDGKCIIDNFLRYEHLLCDFGKVPIFSGIFPTFKKHFSTTNFKSGYRAHDKLLESQMLKSAPFINPIIYSLCELETKKFNYKELGAN